MTVLMFPGQGSQFAGMGKALFDRYPDFTLLADDTLGYSVKELCVNNPDNRLSDTRYVQPAIFVVNALAYQHYLDTGGKPPNWLVGHSLGEYSALYASGAFDFRVGLKITQARGRITADVRDGGMAAVVGIESDILENLLAELGMQDVYIANYNTQNQTVLAGNPQGLAELANILEERGAYSVALNVNGAFHSPFMAHAFTQLKNIISAIPFIQLTCPVLSNVTAKPYTEDTFVELLSSQLVKPVKWKQSIEYLIDKDTSDYIEIGPGSTLTGLAKSVQRSISETQLVS
ncbi:ACP S-malonyltransferase [Teredinibacter turnerae]|uniref:ACP S-malonyltransferase n=1 Tax=Teredinibacter turnerae TaxID=2426 RepID=UPI00040512C7|nr:ACP S-malonyltransferase [Teredinibacter turnerae]